MNRSRIIGLVIFGMCVCSSERQAHAQTTNIVQPGQVDAINIPIANAVGSLLPLTNVQAVITAPNFFEILSSSTLTVLAGDTQTLTINFQIATTAPPGAFTVGVQVQMDTDSVVPLPSSYVDNVPFQLDALTVSDNASPPNQIVPPQTGNPNTYASGVTASGNTGTNGPGIALISLENDSASGDGWYQEQDFDGDQTAATANFPQPGFTLTSGNYLVELVDENGGVASSTFTVTAPYPELYSSGLFDAIGQTYGGGAVVYTPQGGGPPAVGLEVQESLPHTDTPLGAIASVSLNGPGSYDDEASASASTSPESAWTTPSPPTANSATSNGYRSRSNGDR